MFDGSIIIGDQLRQTSQRFAGISQGFTPEHGFGSAGAGEVTDACLLAAQAADSFGAAEPETRARFLEMIADEILALGDVLIDAAISETSLLRGRLEGERGRTVNQLRLFATEVRQGRWLDLTIDTAMPERNPPRADLRRMNRPVGPVAIFGASNFPLAFSVAGGDTASAFAAGCPVVVKGHPGHPATGELVARAIAAAVRRAGMHPGVFSFLSGESHALGTTLVADPRIQAVGFTGSRAGGLALVEIAAQRAQPIPVYAEMSAVNPVILLPAALSRGPEALGAAFIASLTLGAGQFCTNPGLVFAIAGEHLDRFLAAAAGAVADAPPQTMLTPAIDRNYARGVAMLEAKVSVDLAACGRHTGKPGALPALFVTDARTFLADPSLAEEVFGASSLVIRASDEDELERLVAGLDGQLTATLHLEDEDSALAQRLMPILADKAGRILANGWPTGVEVTHAMVHGGPFPATSDGRTTSVGTLAMSRFLRPVCYQDIPDDLLPTALQDANPWQLPRRIDGQWEVA